MNSDVACPSYVRNLYRRFVPHKDVSLCIVCSEASNVLWVMLTRRVHHSCARSWRVSRAVTLGERLGPRSRADGAGPSASVAAVACAPAEGRCLRLARPGRWRANVVETLATSDLSPKFQLEYIIMTSCTSFTCEGRYVWHVLERVLVETS